MGCNAIVIGKKFDADGCRWHRLIVNIAGIWNTWGIVPVASSPVMNVAGKLLQQSSWTNMRVFWNGGTPKWSILMIFSIVNHPFWGTTTYGNPHMCLKYLPADIISSMWTSPPSCESWIQVSKVDFDPYSHVSSCIHWFRLSSYPCPPKKLLQKGINELKLSSWWFESKCKPLPMWEKKQLPKLFWWFQCEISRASPNLTPNRGSSLVSRYFQGLSGKATSS